MTSGYRNVVLGLGNTLNMDEGMGVHALALLRQEIGAETSLELLDGGTLGLNLLPIVEEAGHLLIFDAVDAGKSPGTIVELGGDDIPLLAGVKLSQHQLTFQEVLGLARFRGRIPGHLHLIGVQPGDLSIGIGMSDAVQRAIPGVLQRAKGLLGEWGFLLK